MVSFLPKTQRNGNWTSIQRVFALPLPGTEAIFSHLTTLTTTTTTTGTTTS